MCLGYVYFSYLMETSTETPLILASRRKSMNVEKKENSEFEIVF